MTPVVIPTTVKEQFFCDYIGDCSIKKYENILLRLFKLITILQAKCFNTRCFKCVKKIITKVNCGIKFHYKISEI